MMVYLLKIGFILSLLILLGILLWRRNTPGRTVYLDQGKHSRSFKSNKHRLVAKPDRIMSAERGEVIPHEFKSRKGSVSRRDVTQISVATIAVRDSGYKVSRANIEYGSGHIHTEPMPSNEEMMEGRIGNLVSLVRRIKKSEVPEATPAVHKCRYCPYRNACSFAAE